jgi:superoxide dismutase, Fe-Mn family
MNVRTSMPFQLPALPWKEGELEPVISARTIALHHGKHHKAYVDKLNQLVAGTPYAEIPLHEVIVRSVGRTEDRKIFNNAAQHWNHSFFWKCLTPRMGSRPKGVLAERIDSDLGGLDAFKKEFEKTAVECFGSGWAWLVLRDGKLEILSTSNAATPIAMGAAPLLTLDVWEHAYYVDYENRRPEYVKAVTAKLLDWDFAHSQLEQALGEAKAA